MKQCTEKLFDFYNNDIDIITFPDEIQQFKSIMKKNSVTSPSEMLQFIIKNNIISTFPNVEIILRIYLTLPLSNASGERSFSVLKRVKNYLRNSLGQDKLSTLALLQIEAEFMESLDYDEIIENLAANKARKKAIK